MVTRYPEKGVSLEVLGTCITNTRRDSTHDAIVEYHHLWSYAQQAALVAVCDLNAKDNNYCLITDPERRAKRIAGHYADLYFKSADKTAGNMQFHWVALAAFVVKDIVEAYRYAREDVLQHEWKDAASVARNSSLADLGSLGMTNDSPYQHVLRTYAALAKGNLWLFMDIYPWLWFFLEYGVNPDGSLNQQRLAHCLPERDWNTFQTESKNAVDALPFGPKWLAKLGARLAADPIYKKAGECFSTKPSWNAEGGYGEFAASAGMAHRYVQAHVNEYDNGYRAPASNYWGKFQQAYYVMESEHTELTRIVNDGAAGAVLAKARDFKVTDDIRDAYQQLSIQHAAGNEFKFKFKMTELVAIAKHEQLNILQPLIYNDPKLKETIDLNHRLSRLTGGWLSPQFKVVYSFSAQTDDPRLKTIFDDPNGITDQLRGTKKSLTNKEDRMAFVKKIADKFNFLMRTEKFYIEQELKKIQAWSNS